MMNPMTSVSRLEKSDRTNTSTDSAHQRECLIGIQNSGRPLSTLYPSPSVFCYSNIFPSLSKTSSKALHKTTVKQNVWKFLRKTLPKSGFAFECRYLWCQADTLKSTGQESFHKFLCKTVNLEDKVLPDIVTPLWLVSYVPVLSLHRCCCRCSWIAFLRHGDHTLNSLWLGRGATTNTE